MHTEISLATKFRFKLTLLNFWIKLTQKRYFRNKIMKITIEFWIFKLIYILNFSFNNFNSWGNPPPLTPFPPPKKKKVYLRSKSEKNEHHYWVLLHFQISLCTIFELKLTIFIFLTRFAQKDISSRKQKKLISPWSSAYLN